MVRVNAIYLIFFLNVFHTALSFRNHMHKNNICFSTCQDKIKTLGEIEGALGIRISFVSR